MGEKLSTFNDIEYSERQKLRLIKETRTWQEERETQEALTSNTHYCTIEGCNNMCAASTLFCSSHWIKAPKDKAKRMGVIRRVCARKHIPLDKEYHELAKQIREYFKEVDNDTGGVSKTS